MEALDTGTFVDMVARAIQQKPYGNGPSIPWSECAPETQDHFRQCARAALAAMEMPTVAMLFAGSLQLEIIEGLTESYAKNVWGAMISAAQAED